jgi:hypothetical protein
MQALRQLAARAGAWARAAGSWLRSDEESIPFCSRCDARIYLRVASPPVSDGEVHFRAVPGAVVRGDHPRTRSDPAGRNDDYEREMAAKRDRAASVCRRREEEDVEAGVPALSPTSTPTAPSTWTSTNGAASDSHLPRCQPRQPFPHSQRFPQLTLPLGTASQGEGTGKVRRLTDDCRRRNRPIRSVTARRAHRGRSERCPRSGESGGAEIPSSVARAASGGHDGRLA